MSDVAIKLDHVSKKYSIGKEKDGSLRGTLATIFTKKSEKSEDFRALKDISFEVQKGDVVGIIGKNGAGKSTLLKILSQITRPTEGRIEINGRVASLLEVGTGFHPELTGRENIFLNGTILGMTRKEVQSKFDEIVAFSGIEKFIDTPVKHYSSGMYVRLAFAVAAHLEPEILIIDEVLAVGDAEFQKKCLGKMKDVAGEGRTVLFVSHDLAAVRNLCTRGIVLKEGQMIFNGNTTEAISIYNQNQFTTKDFFNESIDKLKDYDIHSIQIKNEKGKSQHIFEISDKIVIDFDFYIKPHASLYSMYLCIKNTNGTKAFSIDKKIEKEHHQFIIDSYCLTRGSYTLEIFIQIPQRFRLGVYEDVTMFQVVDHDSELAVHGSYDYGNTFGKYVWQ